MPAMLGVENLTIVPTGNKKLAHQLVWDMPRLVTCAGRTSFCEYLCYANQGNYRQPWVKNKIARNYQYWKKFKQIPPIDPAAANAVESGAIKFFRFHSSGDFFSPEYIHAVHVFVRVHSFLPFLAYTRGWRVNELRPHLAMLAAEPNMRLWASCDPDSGSPDTNYRHAYMSDNDKPADFAVDLVFRAFTRSGHHTNRRRMENPVKTIGGAPVCPEENGYLLREIEIEERGQRKKSILAFVGGDPDRGPFTCGKCGICWRKPTIKYLEEPIRGYGGYRSLGFHDYMDLIEEDANNYIKMAESGDLPSYDWEAAIEE